MNQTAHRLLGLAVSAGTALLALTTPTARAQTWETILQLDSGLAGAKVGGGANRALMIDPTSATAEFPRLIATGKTLDDGVNDIPEKLHLIQQPEDPDGSACVPLDANARTVFSLASDAAGNLYWAGDYSINSTTSGWLVRRSSDGGATWATIRTFSLGGATAQARGIAIDLAGNLIVCGVAFDSAGYSHWIVETSADRGATWATRDVFKSPAPSSLTTGDALVQALGVAAIPGSNGGLFVVGSLGKRNSFVGTWTVTRSRDGGQTWEKVDSWLPSSKGGFSRARKVAADASGRIFVMGDSGGGHERDPSPWVVRMSADSGNTGTWTTIFGPWQDGVAPVPWDMTVDADNNVWIAGEVLRRYPVGPGKNSYGYFAAATAVRLQESLSGVWSPTIYPLTPEYPHSNATQASSITADAWGRVYVNGTFRETLTSPIQWFVQRLIP